MSLHSRIRSALVPLLTSIKALFVRRHKQKLSLLATDYAAYPELLFVVQVHNTAETLSSVLVPLIRLRVKNLLIIADGCVDLSSLVASTFARAPGHLIITRNNTYEINNYRLSLSVAQHLGASYVVLLQDDDAYASLQPWLDCCLDYFRHDPLVAIIGLNAGFLLNSCIPRRADVNFCSATWYSSDDSDSLVCGLSGYYQLVVSSVSHTPDASMCQYVASVNRAPQIISVSIANELGFFPPHFEPYQYDDDYNCFSAWLGGYHVLHAPISSKYSIRPGGMRIYGKVTPSSRPDFFARNYNYLLDKFGQQWADGSIQQLVDRANQRVLAKLLISAH